MIKNLCDTIRCLAEDMNYSCHVGFIGGSEGLNSSGIQMPCVWVNPPQLTGITGRKEGERQFALTAYLLAENYNRELGQALCEAEKIERWSKLMNDAHSIARGLSPDYNVASLTLSPDEYSLTGYGELSVQVIITISEKWYECAD